MTKKGLRSCQKVKKETKSANLKIFDYEISSINKIHSKVLVTVNYTIGPNEETIQSTNSNQSNT